MIDVFTMNVLLKSFEDLQSRPSFLSFVVGFTNKCQQFTARAVTVHHYGVSSPCTLLDLSMMVLNVFF